MLHDLDSINHIEHRDFTHALQADGFEANNGLVFCFSVQFYSLIYLNGASKAVSEK